MVMKRSPNNLRHHVHLEGHGVRADLKKSSNATRIYLCAAPYVAGVIIRWFAGNLFRLIHTDVEQQQKILSSALSFFVRLLSHRWQCSLCLLQTLGICTNASFPPSCFILLCLSIFLQRAFPFVFVKFRYSVLWSWADPESVAQQFATIEQ